MQGEIELDEAIGSEADTSMGDQRSESTRGMRAHCTLMATEANMTEYMQQSDTVRVTNACSHSPVMNEPDILF